MLNALYILELNEKTIEERIKVKKHLAYTSIPFIIIGILGLLTGIGLFSLGIFKSLEKMNISALIIIAPIIFILFAVLFVFGYYRLTLYKAINLEED